MAKSLKAKRTLHVQYLPYAKCADCEWSWPMSRSARDEAKFHVETADHVVVVEIVTADQYKLEEK